MSQNTVKVMINNDTKNNKKEKMTISSDERCISLTKSGNRCMNKKKQGMDICIIHHRKNLDDNPKEIKNPEKIQNNICSMCNANCDSSYNIASNCKIMCDVCAQKFPHPATLRFSQKGTTMFDRR